MYRVWSEYETVLQGCDYHLERRHSLIHRSSQDLCELQARRHSWILWRRKGTLTLVWFESFQFLGLIHTCETVKVWKIGPHFIWEKVLFTYLGKVLFTYLGKVSVPTLLTAQVKKLFATAAFLAFIKLIKIKWKMRKWIKWVPCLNSPGWLIDSSSCGARGEHYLSAIQSKDCQVQNVSNPPIKP